MPYSRSSRSARSLFVAAAFSAAAAVSPASADTHCSEQFVATSCVAQFCAVLDGDADCTAAWYTVDGSRYSCTSCTDLTRCAQDAVEACSGSSVTPSTPSSGSDGENSCEYAQDDMCDEPYLCAEGTDTSDCEEYGCTVSARRAARFDGGLGVVATLLGLLALVFTRARRRKSREEA